MITFDLRVPSQLNRIILFGYRPYLSRLTSHHQYHDQGGGVEQAYGTAS